MALSQVLPNQKVSTSAVLKRDDNQSYYHYIDCIITLMVALAFGLLSWGHLIFNNIIDLCCIIFTLSL